eukprot:4851506-Prymnesium_polylepis.1
MPWPHPPLPAVWGLPFSNSQELGEAWHSLIGFTLATAIRSWMPARWKRCSWPIQRSRAALCPPTQSVSLAPPRNFCLLWPGGWE